MLFICAVQGKFRMDMAGLKLDAMVMFLGFGTWSIRIINLILKVLPTLLEVPNSPLVSRSPSRHGGNSTCLAPPACNPVKWHKGWRSVLNQILQVVRNDEFVC